MDDESRDLAGRDRTLARGRISDAADPTVPDGRVPASRTDGGMSPAMRKGIYIALLVIVALVFAFPVADVMGSKETYRGSIEKLDAKAQTVTALVGTTTAAKLALLALALTLVVPASVQVSNMIEETFEYDAASASSEMDAGTAAAATESADAADDAQTSDEASSASSGEVPDASTDPIGAFAAWVGGLGEDIGSALSGAGTALSSGVTGILDTAKDWVARLIEAFAVMIVTNCVIPVVVLLFFVWIINVLMGLNIELPARPGASLLRRHRARG